LKKASLSNPAINREKYSLKPTQCGHDDGYDQYAMATAGLVCECVCNKILYIKTIFVL
jgi:hypothetical protein